jgi:hypothetical protein
LHDALNLLKMALKDKVVTSTDAVATSSPQLVPMRQTFLLDRDKEPDILDILEDNCTSPVCLRRQEDVITFHLFPDFPAELRMKIWEVSLAPRIVRLLRMNDRSVFTAPSKELPLMWVCRESREAAFLYGKYMRIVGSSSKVYFSPLIDYLWLDPGWTDWKHWKPRSKDDQLRGAYPFLFQDVRNIMVHPNWSGERRIPATSLASLPHVERVLVGADESSIGRNSDVMLGTMQDINSYYLAFKKDRPETKMPYIAVGCLGWTGKERTNFRHGKEDGRQLVKVFEGIGEMKAHVAFLREEQQKFAQDRFDHPKIVHNLRWVKNGRTLQEVAIKSSGSAAANIVEDSVNPTASPTSSIANPVENLRGQPGSSKLDDTQSGDNSTASEKEDESEGPREPPSPSSAKQVPRRLSDLKSWFRRISLVKK